MASSAGHPKYTLGGTDTVKVSQPVAKGQGVEVDPANPGHVRPWSANSVTRVGVAQIPGVPEGGNAVDNFAPTRPHISVQRAPLVVNMVFDAPATWRQALVAAADGKVTPATGTPPAGALVGYCDARAGVTAGGTGPVELV